jgi:hypothetical protein
MMAVKGGTPLSRQGTTPRPKDPFPGTEQHLREEPFNQLQDALDQPAFEIHLGEIASDGNDRTRVCVIWINGRRWSGLVLLDPAGT